jgi:hypothetical protein
VRADQRERSASPGTATWAQTRRMWWPPRRSRCVTRRRETGVWNTSVRSRCPGALAITRAVRARPRRPLRDQCGAGSGRRGAGESSDRPCRAWSHCGGKQNGQSASTSPRTPRKRVRRVRALAVAPSGVGAALLTGPPIGTGLRCEKPPGGSPFTGRQSWAGPTLRHGVLAAEPVTW